MQSSQLQNVGLQSTVNESNEETPAWARDPTVAPLAFFSPRPRKIRATKQFVSELAQWRKSEMGTLRRLKGVPRRIMMFLQTEALYLDNRILLECDLEDEIIALVALYMDFELRILTLSKKEQEHLRSEGKDPQNRLIQDAQYFPKYEQWLINRCSRWLYTLLPAHDRRVDALLSTTVHSRKTRAVLDPLFRKVLWETPKGPLNSVSYVRHMIAYKIWRERALVAEDEGSKALNDYVRLHLHPKDFKSFPRPLLRCLGRGSTHEKHARPNNINLKDACLCFKQCKDLPDTISDAINYESLEIFKTKGDEVDEIMDMITERKNKRKAVCTAVIDLTSEDVIDLTAEDVVEEPLFNECAANRVSRTADQFDCERVRSSLRRNGLNKTITTTESNPMFVRSWENRIDYSSIRTIAPQETISPFRVVSEVLQETAVPKTTISLPVKESIETTVPKVFTKDVVILEDDNSLRKEQHLQDGKESTQRIFIETTVPEVSRDLVNLADNKTLRKEQHLQDGKESTQRIFIETTVPEVSSDVVNLEDNNSLRKEQHLQDGKESTRRISIETTVPEVSRDVMTLEDNNSLQEATTEDVEANLDVTIRLSETSTDGQHLQVDEPVRLMLIEDDNMLQKSSIDNRHLQDGQESKETKVPDVSRDVVNLEDNNSLQEPSTNEHLQDNNSTRPILKETSIPELPIEDVVIVEDDNSLQEASKYEHRQEEESTQMILNETTGPEVSADVVNLEDNDCLQELSTNDRLQEEISTRSFLIETSLPKVPLDDDNCLQEASTYEHLQNEESTQTILNETNGSEVSADVVNLEDNNCLQEPSTDEYLQKEISNRPILIETSVPEVPIEDDNSLQNETNGPEVSADVVTLEDNNNLQEPSTDEHLQEEISTRSIFIETSLPKVPLDDVKDDNSLQEASKYELLQDEESTQTILNETIGPEVFADVINLEGNNSCLQNTSTDQHLQDEKSTRTILTEMRLSEVSADVVNLEDNNSLQDTSTDQHLQDEKSTRAILTETTVSEVSAEVVNLEDNNSLQKPSTDEHLQDENSTRTILTETTVSEVSAEVVNLEDNNSLQEPSTDEHLQGENSTRTILTETTVFEVSVDVVNREDNNSLQEPSTDEHLQDENSTRSMLVETTMRDVFTEDVVDLEDNNSLQETTTDEHLEDENSTRPMLTETTEPKVPTEDHLQEESMRQITNSTCADLPQIPETKSRVPIMSEVFRETYNCEDDDSSQSSDDGEDIQVDAQTEQQHEQVKDLQEIIQRFELLVVPHNETRNENPIESNTALSTREEPGEKISQDLIDEKLPSPKSSINDETSGMKTVAEKEELRIVETLNKTSEYVSKNLEVQNKNLDEKSRSILQFMSGIIDVDASATSNNLDKEVKERITIKKVKNNLKQKKIRKLYTKQEHSTSVDGNEKESPKMQLLLAVELVPLAAEENIENDKRVCNKKEEKLNQIQPKMELRIDSKIKGKRKNGTTNNNFVTNGNERIISNHVDTKVAKRKRGRPAKFPKLNQGYSATEDNAQDVLTATVVPVAAVKVQTDKAVGAPIQVKSFLETIEQSKTPRRRKQSLKDTLNWDSKLSANDIKNLTLPTLINDPVEENAEKEKNRKKRGRPLKPASESFAENLDSDDEMPLSLRVTQKQDIVEHVPRAEAKNYRLKRCRLAKCVAEIAVSEQMNDSSESPSPTRDALEVNQCDKSPRTVENIEQVLLPTSPVEEPILQSKDPLSLEISVSPKSSKVRRLIKSPRKNTKQNIRGYGLVISNEIAVEEPILQSEDPLSLEIFVSPKLSKIRSIKPPRKNAKEKNTKGFGIAISNETKIEEPILQSKDPLSLGISVSPKSSEIRRSIKSPRKNTKMIRGYKLPISNEKAASNKFRRKKQLYNKINIVKTNFQRNCPNIPRTSNITLKIPDEQVATLERLQPPPLNEVEITENNTDPSNLVEEASNVLTVGEMMEPEETLQSSLNDKQDDLIETEKIYFKIDKEKQSDIKELQQSHLEIEETIAVLKKPVLIPPMIANLFEKCYSVASASNKTDCLCLDTRPTNFETEEVSPIDNVEKQEETSLDMLPLDLSLGSKRNDSISTNIEESNKTLDNLVIETNTEEIFSETCIVSSDMLNTSANSSEFYNPVTSDISSDNIKIVDPPVVENSSLDICSELEISHENHKMNEPTCVLDNNPVVTNLDDIIVEAEQQIIQNRSKTEELMEQKSTMIFKVIGEVMISLPSLDQQEQHENHSVSEESQSNKCVTDENEQEDVPEPQNEVIISIPENDDDDDNLVKEKDVVVINEGNDVMIPDIITILDYLNTPGITEQTNNKKYDSEEPLTLEACIDAEGSVSMGDPLTPPNSNDVNDFDNLQMLVDTAADLVKPAVEEPAYEKVLSELENILYPDSPPTENSSPNPFADDVQASSSMEKKAQPKDKEPARKKKSSTRKNYLHKIALVEKKPSPKVSDNTSKSSIRRTPLSKVLAGNSRTATASEKKQETDVVNKKQYQEITLSPPVSENTYWNSIRRRTRVSKVVAGNSKTAAFEKKQEPGNETKKQCQETTFSLQVSENTYKSSTRQRTRVSKVVTGNSKTTVLEKKQEAAFDKLMEQHKKSVNSSVEVTPQPPLECVFDKLREEHNKLITTTPKVEETPEETAQTIAQRPSELEFDKLLEEHKKSLTIVGSTENQFAQTRVEEAPQETILQRQTEGVFDTVMEEHIESIITPSTTAGSSENQSRQTKIIEEAPHGTCQTIAQRPSELEFDKLLEEHKKSLNTTTNQNIMNSLGDVSDSEITPAMPQQKIDETPQVPTTDTGQTDHTELIDNAGCNSMQGIGHDWLIGEYIETIVESTEIEKELSAYECQSDGQHEICCVVEHEGADEDEQLQEAIRVSIDNCTIDWSKVDWSRVDLSKIDWSKIDLPMKSLIEQHAGRNNGTECEENRKRKMSPSQEDAEHSISIKKQKIANQDNQPSNNHQMEQGTFLYFNDSPSHSELLCTEILTGVGDDLYYETLELFEQDQKTEVQIKTVDEDSVPNSCEDPHKISDYFVADLKEVEYNEFSKDEMTLVNMNNLQPQKNGENKLQEHIKYNDKNQLFNQGENVNSIQYKNVSWENAHKEDQRDRELAAGNLFPAHSQPNGLVVKVPTFNGQHPNCETYAPLPIKRKITNDLNKNTALNSSNHTLKPNADKNPNNSVWNIRKIHADYEPSELIQKDKKNCETRKMTPISELLFVKSTKRVYTSILDRDVGNLLMNYCHHTAQSDSDAVSSSSNEDCRGQDTTADEQDLDKNDRLRNLNYGQNHRTNFF